MPSKPFIQADMDSIETPLMPLTTPLADGLPPTPIEIADALCRHPQLLWSTIQELDSRNIAVPWTKTMPGSIGTTKRSSLLGANIAIVQLKEPGSWTFWSSNAGNNRWISRQQAEDAADDHLRANGWMLLDG